MTKIRFDENYEYGLIVICLLLVLNLIAMAIKRLQPVVKDVPTTIKQPRFRKRDKVIFFGRKMLRKVRTSFQKSGNHRIFRLNPYLHPEFISLRPTSTFTNVTIIGASDDVPLEAFCIELNQALTALGTVITLSSDYIREVLGQRAFDVSNEAKLSSWLKEQKDQHQLILYQCDRTFTTWSHRCIRAADCILVVGLANSPPTIGRVERQLDSIAVNTQKELVLLHSNPSKSPENTVLWLNMRAWCSWHHHIRCPKRMFIKKSPMEMKEYYSIVTSEPIAVHSDLSRLARCLTGTSVGLVLGGGGARGSAHAGMIKAIMEAGIPIDMIGGVSIGAFMGALYCQEGDYNKFNQKARRWALEMTSYWRQILDLTYPVTAMFSGAAFNRTIHNVFGEKQAEDLWLPFFCITTDISSSCMRIHRYGSLWRYVRSSMSLSGYLPPLCDPVDGHLLLDGGYVNNLPADVMKEVMGAHTTLAVDVGSQDETDLYNYGDTLNGWWLLWKRWNPWATPVKVPSLPEIQSRLAFVSCVRQLERVKNSSYCTYIRPPIDRFKTFQFGSYDEIMNVGYSYGNTFFNDEKFDSLIAKIN
ncbi:patatin-like phospholipase domain-containing protein 6 [Panonychus citri]|uniref:patatin-like phospholipase domain-containing protein 6 n=1 Tax=Panonychus citri TaxID=50023 RepID=UPI0023070A01|nr:patatin-like phospholipase domain-containing protein 6 [Panonychus citri]